VTSITAWAWEKGKLPSEVYEQYLRNPRDFQLLFSYGNYKTRKEEEEMKKSQKGSRG
jgi:hypothetical protein